MAVYTKDDLVDRVLVRLGEVGLGQSAEPEMRARVVKPLDGILDELKLDRVYEFGAANDVPGEAFDPLCWVVAARVARDAGVPDDGINQLAAESQGAVVRLRRYRALSASETYTRLDFF